MLDGDARARVSDGSQPGAGSPAEHEFRAFGESKLDGVGAGLAEVAAVHNDPSFDFVAEVCLRRGMPWKPTGSRKSPRRYHHGGYNTSH